MSGNDEHRTRKDDLRIRITLEENGAVFSRRDEDSPFFFPPVNTGTHFLVAKHGAYPKEESVLAFRDEERRKKGKHRLKVS